MSDTIRQGADLSADTLYARTRSFGTVPSWTDRGNPARAEITVRLVIGDHSRDPEHPATLVDHRPQLRQIDVSLVGHRTRGRVDEGGGQNVDDLRDPGFVPRAPFTRADVARLAELWDRWHLNTMRAGCAHMPTLAEIEAAAPAGAIANKYGRPDVVGYAIDHVTCPETGYRYGRAWLVEPVPLPVLVELVELFEREGGADNPAGRVGSLEAVESVAVDLDTE